MATQRRRGYMYCTRMAVTAGRHSRNKTFIICRISSERALAADSSMRDCPKKKNSHMILRSLGRPLIRDQCHFTISKSYMKLLKFSHIQLKIHPTNYISSHSETCCTHGSGLEQAQTRQQFQYELLTPNNHRDMSIQRSPDSPFRFEDRP